MANFDEYFKEIYKIESGEEEIVEEKKEIQDEISGPLDEEIL